MRKLILISTLALLAGCGTPQERCIAGATRDLRIVDRLIGETDRNLERGYALEDVVRTRTRWVMCRPPKAATKDKEAEPARMCMRDSSYTVTRPKAINLAEEREKLAELEKKRAELLRSAAREVAGCKIAHPE
ncbi:hypothetical protein EOK75_11705 [Pseudorhodobacter turbinis]|uniref:Lipoprotein n=1 Tax=Pseudorhodobacter turbinis TaxID=2500533 RepID=A0A4P8EHF8_9RHOB|nr:hypothetical protein [Pseudorhodobacter turbinis]QCO56337.1 hypothetical protein EOK75_11705 [Pseudorhodobacter turbinis]